LLEVVGVDTCPLSRLEQAVEVLGDIELAQHQFLLDHIQ
jgi:hypothetical protein